MNHEHIESQNLVERYVLGHLEEVEQEHFEDHFADCPRCLEAVELAQELRAGLVASEPSEFATEAEVVAFPRPAPRRAAWGAVLPWAAVVALALLPSAWLAWRNADLRQRIEGLERPVVATPDAMLELYRAEAGRTVVVTPDPEAAWVHLAVDLGDLGTEVDHTPTLAASLATGDGEPLWTDGSLPAPPRGPLTLSFPRRLLPPGSYRLELSLRAGDHLEPVGGFAFEVKGDP